MTALDFDCTPFPSLPLDLAEPATPKRVRRTSESLNRRVKANIGSLCVPNMNEIGAGSRLQLQPQARSLVSSSYSKHLLQRSMKKIQERQKQAQAAAKASPQSAPRSLVRAAPTKKNLPVIKNMRSGTSSLLSLRMAAMLKGSGECNTKAHMKFGAPRTFNVPGRASSSPYRPSRAIPLRNRSFNAVCA